MLPWFRCRVLLTLRRCAVFIVLPPLFLLCRARAHSLYIHTHSFLLTFGNCMFFSSTAKGAGSARGGGDKGPAVQTAGSVGPRARAVRSHEKCGLRENGEEKERPWQENPPPRAYVFYRTKKMSSSVVLHCQNQKARALRKCFLLKRSLCSVMVCKSGTKRAPRNIPNKLSVLRSLTCFGFRTQVAWPVEVQKLEVFPK